MNDSISRILEELEKRSILEKSRSIDVPQHKHGHVLHPQGRTVYSSQSGADQSHQAPPCPG